MTVALQKQRYKILLVDDEAAVVASVSYVLKHAGHSVDSVDDGDVALARIGRISGAIVLITDHAMRRITGLDLVERLQGSRFRGEIIVLSRKFDERH